MSSRATRRTWTRIARSRGSFENERDTSGRLLQREGLSDALGALRTMKWRTAIGIRRLQIRCCARPSTAVRELEKRGKILVESQSGAAHYIEQRLEGATSEVLNSTREQINNTLYRA